MESQSHLLNTLQLEFQALEERHKLVSEAKDCLEKALEEKGVVIEELNNTIGRLENSQPDNVKLLAAMESDKVAASIAVAQNKELKKQLEGIQQALEVSVSRYYRRFRTVLTLSFLDQRAVRFNWAARDLSPQKRRAEFDAYGARPTASPVVRDNKR